MLIGGKNRVTLSKDAYGTRPFNQHQSTNLPLPHQEQRLTGITVRRHGFDGKGEDVGK